MTDFPIVEVMTVVVSGLAGMWAMFKSLQNNFLKHLERSEQRQNEMLTTKNGHMERIANRFNETVQGFQGVVSRLEEKIDGIDKRV